MHASDIDWDNICPPSIQLTVDGPSRSALRSGRRLSPETDRKAGTSPTNPELLIFALRSGRLVNRVRLTCMGFFLSTFVFGRRDLPERRFCVGAERSRRLSPSRALDGIDRSANSGTIYRDRHRLLCAAKPAQGVAPEIKFAGDSFWREMDSNFRFRAR